MTAHVLLWHLDGRLPNLALMRLAAHHRALGAAWWSPRRLGDQRVSLPLFGGDGR